MTIEVVKDMEINDSMHKIVQSFFPEVQEWIQRPDEPNRALVMVGEGHIPSEYELKQLEPEDWKWMRDVVNEMGSKVFSTRLSMLEDLVNIV